MLDCYVTTKEAINFLSKVPTTNKTIYVKNRIIHNHMADTNVHDEFWGRKYDVNQFHICDYLKKWRKKAGISTKKVDEHFGYEQPVIGLEKIIIQEVFQTQMIGEALRNY